MNTLYLDGVEMYKLIRNGGEPKRVNYDALLDSLAHYEPMNKIAFLSIGTDSEPQAKFSEFLTGLGFSVHSVDFRLGLTNFTPIISFSLGAYQPTTQDGSPGRSIILSSDFNLYMPAMSANSPVTISFFRRAMPHNWSRVNLFKQGHKIEWFDLEPFASEIFGEMPVVTPQPFKMEE